MPRERAFSFFMGPIHAIVMGPEPAPATGETAQRPKVGRAVAPPQA